MSSGREGFVLVSRLESGQCTRKALKTRDVVDESVGWW